MTTWKSNTQRVKRAAQDKARSFVMDVAFQVEAAAKINAPVDTGLLRNSIQSERLSAMQALVFAGVEYAVFVELGTRYAPAQPFLLPALSTVAARVGGKVVKWF